MIQFFEKTQSLSNNTFISNQVLTKIQNVHKENNLIYYD